MKVIYKSQIITALCLLLFGSLLVPGAGQNRFYEKGNQGNETGEWKMYAVEGEEFSVLLPTVPAMTTRSTFLNQENELRRERVLGAYADGVVYAIYAYERKALTLDDLIREIIKDDSAQPEPVTVAGITAKGFRFEDDDRVRATNFFATPKHLYVFKAEGSKLGNSAKGLPKFLSSIRFDKRRGATYVEDGPGGQAILDPARDSHSIFRANDVSKRLSVITKPEPPYTEEARMNQITGTVVLRSVFTSSGAVTNIAVVKGLPLGLTERAIAAARQIKFVPSIKDGRFVSTWMQLEYNFNLY